MKNEKTKVLNINAPSKECSDKHCPFHAGFKIRGRIFTGKIIKDIFHKTTIIEFPRLFYLPKYERYERRRTRIKVHVPDCIEVKKGDNITIAECRPISKTKKFVAIEVK